MGNVDRLRHLVHTSENLVCLYGIGASEDCGSMNYHNSSKAYEIEAKYGYSPEEIFSANFYSTRINQFYQFYHDEVLQHLGEPDACVHTLARLEQDGRLKTVVTRELFSMARRGGCHNVLELHGSVLNNECPRCHKPFDLEYMKQGRPVPLCDQCGQPVRPQITLVGEMINNQIMTRASDAVSKADVLLLLECDLNSMLATTCVKYFHGSHLILIHEEPHFADEKADLVLIGKPRDILPQIYT